MDVTIRFHCTDPPQGTLCAERAQGSTAARQPFRGWLELLTVLEEVTCPAGLRRSTSCPAAGDLGSQLDP